MEAHKYICSIVVAVRLAKTISSEGIGEAQIIFTSEELTFRTLGRLVMPE